MMKIEDFLTKNKVSFKVHEHEPAYTAQEVAAEEHVTGNMMAKAVVVHTKKGYAMCVLPASYKLDMKKVAKAIKARKVRLADEKELAELFPDVEVGAAPPFGNLYNLETLVDEHLTAYDEIMFQADTHRRAIKMKYDAYANLAQPAVADIAVHL